LFLVYLQDWILVNFSPGTADTDRRQTPSCLSASTRPLQAQDPGHASYSSRKGDQISSKYHRLAPFLPVLRMVELYHDRARHPRLLFLHC
jgi:hypothetical protein